METDNAKIVQWEDQVNLTLAVWLFVSPSVLGYGDVVLAAWNAYGVGIIIAVLSIAALIKFKFWEEWSNLVLGCWLGASPWLVGYDATAAATWNHVITGLVIIVLSGWQLNVMANRPQPA